MLLHTMANVLTVLKQDSSLIKSEKAIICIVEYLVPLKRGKAYVDFNF